MSREWKPGDVAVTAGGRERALRTPEKWLFDDGSSTSTFGEEATGFRPVVVIDPEDREQVERLADANERHTPDGLVTPTASTDAMQAALRSLIADPKPDEPQGLGAVVEASNGDLWVRLDAAGVWACASDENKVATYWPTIAAVRVLSEGIKP